MENKVFDVGYISGSHVTKVRKILAPTVEAAEAIYEAEHPNHRERPKHVSTSIVNGMNYNSRSQLNMFKKHMLVGELWYRRRKTQRRWELKCGEDRYIIVNGEPQKLRG